MGLKPRSVGPRLLSATLGRHVSLRPLGFHDEAALYSLVNANRLRLAQWFDWIGKITCTEDIGRFLVQTDRMHVAESGVRCAILVGGHIAGVIGLEGMGLFHRNAFIGYWLALEYEGKGVMTRAVRAVCSYGFSKRKLHRIEIQAATTNTRSLAVAERVGFRREGVLRQVTSLNGHWRNHVVLSLLESEWRAAQVRR